MSVTKPTYQGLDSAFIVRDIDRNLLIDDVKVTKDPHSSQLKRVWPFVIMTSSLIRFLKLMNPSLMY